MKMMNLIDQVRSAKTITEVRAIIKGHVENGGVLGRGVASAARQVLAKKGTKRRFQGFEVLNTQFGLK